jgi:hypothetical protein
MTRACIRCGREITACMGFSLARDMLSGRRPIREHCGWCVEELEITGQRDSYLNNLDASPCP